ncbi:MAG TPA: bifunctional transaldolase/phosoglucose isomerase [Candidatus Acidoferrales bacterium]|nr:bifunctional transaldolase/phosoglucose isomerase [Candidatus Acidoferrales bacterium]
MSDAKQQSGGQTAVANPLKGLNEFGQSVWFDYIRRSMLTSGELDRLIDEDGLRGVTSNPAIFEKAITGSKDYTDQVAVLEKQDVDPMFLYEQLAIQDIQGAADRLLRVYERTKRRDGYVSLEVSPYLARDTKATMSEARRLWKAVGRPNVMIKVPATPEGVPAIEQLLSEGININVTLLFAMSAWEAVANAYIRGLERYAASGGDVSHVASVASFFISRIDSLVDSQLEAKMKAAVGAERYNVEDLLGKTAIANAKLTYARYKEIFSGPKWQALVAKGAQTQRLLWASTGTKNPAYSDVLYVEELIGPDTVNTMPPATYDAFRAHGVPKASLEKDLAGAKATMEAIARLGVNMEQATAKLLDDGVKLFAEAFDKLLASVDKTCKFFSKEKLNRQTYSLPEPIGKEVAKTLEDWRLTGKVRRLWGRDATLWTGADEAKWLGWLGICDDQLAHLDKLTGFASAVKKEGFTQALLLGMGGSSLCPEVLKMTYGKIAGAPELFVLDSTDPEQIRAVDAKIDYPHCLFIVSSKSGSTLEPNIFKAYFFERAKQTLGAEQAPKHFVAITDPGSQMQRVAEADKFRWIFYGLPSIGGRFSALSNFGMVPAAAMGLDVPNFLDRAEEMVHACAACVKAEDNPGVSLGVVMGVAAKHGRDKVTIIASPAIHDLGAWLEQLLAESSGKEGKGLIPVDREPLLSPENYGNDRLFAYLRLETGSDAGQDKAVEALEKAGHPVVRIAVKDIYDIGQEFFRWEIAISTAGAVIGINAFNQPDVEASKIETRKLTAEYEEKGKLPPETPILEEAGVKLFTDAKNAAELAKATGGEKTLVAYLRAHFNRIKPGDYFALLGYIDMNEANEKELSGMRKEVMTKKKAATCLGFGPRFLHSTGQAYKGGPNTGVFLQLTCDDANDLPVPGQKYTFGVVKAAQARGDFEVLAERGRRALRVHLGSGVAACLRCLRRAVTEALG